MGEVNVKIFLENIIDRLNFQSGLIKEDEIRNLKTEGLVDIGAVMLMLPEDMVETLGLDIFGKVIVTYANESKEECPVAGPVSVKIGQREMRTDCVVGKPRSETLIGQIVLEELDLIVDCNAHAVKPNPESPYLPMLKMK
ncbi:MAG: clan AA aspartic protease [bacterium]|nr:clan AA aspartic protease [bacterium]